MGHFGFLPVVACGSPVILLVNVHGSVQVMFCYLLPSGKQ